MLWNAFYDHSTTFPESSIEPISPASLTIMRWVFLDHASDSGAVKIRPKSPTIPVPTT